MARGKSPVIGDNGVNATPEELRKYTRYAMEIFKRETIDINDADQVRQAIIDYFNMCEREGIKPANLGLYAYLGLSKQQAHNITSGRDKVNPASRDLIQKAQHSLSSYREGLAIDNKLNPATAIFWAKNYDGMTDTQTIEVTTDRQDAPQLTQAELAKRIPVYSDIEQDA